MTNTAVSAGLTSDEELANFDAMLESMGMNTDEIIDVEDDDDSNPYDTKSVDLVNAGLVSEVDLEAAVVSATQIESALEAYAEQDKQGVVGEMNLEAADKPAKVAKVKSERKPREPSAVTVSGKLMAKTSGDVGVFILEPADADLDAAALELHMKQIIEAADALPVKAGNKMHLLFGYLKNGGKLNEYLRRAFEVLDHDGEIKTGDAGNYIQAMTKPEAGRKAFGLGTARSQVSQLGALLPFLKVATKESGRLVLNPDSVIFAAHKANLAV